MALPPRVRMQIILTVESYLDNPKHEQLILKTVRTKVQQAFARSDIESPLRDVTVIGCVSGGSHPIGARP